MAQFDNRYAQAAVAARTGAAVDEGLRAYMLTVYNYMAAGVALTGIVAYMLFSAAVTGDPGSAVARLGNGIMLTEFGRTLYVSPLRWVLMLAPLAFVFFLSFRVYQMSVGAAQLTFWLFAAVMGASLSTIFLVYTGASIATTFFATAVAFLSLSIYGYTTKRNLQAFGTFLVMGVVGLIVASLLNLWMQSSALQMGISAIGVLLFAGLTAYDTQRIKEQYAYVAGSDMMGKAVIMGALSLYLDFINMFQFLLSFLGDRE